MRVSRNPLAWATVATTATLLGKLLVAGTVVVVGQKTITFGNLDSGLVAALLGPTLTAYVASRHRSMAPHQEADRAHGEPPAK